MIRIGGNEMNENINSLLKGAVDMHCHSYPEISLDFMNTRQEDIEALEECKQYGMQGIVYKANMFPTIGMAYTLNKQLESIKAYSSITLNVSSGGLSPISVEAAAKLGAKVVHFPTYSARNDFTNGGWCMADEIGKYLDTVKNYTEAETITVLDEDGELKPEVIKILEIAQANGMTTFTGHLSKEESFAMIRQAKVMNYDKIVWCHPLTYKVSDEDLKEAIEMGAYVEFNYTWFVPTLHGDFPQRVAEFINEVGADRVILTSDHFYTYAPSPAECMRMWAATLLHFDVDPEEIRKAMVNNPCRLMDLDPDWEPEFGNEE